MMLRARVVWGPVCIGLVLTACRPPQQPVTRWIADSIATLDIPATGPGGAKWLVQPVGATRFISGEVAVADAGTRTLDFFNAHGHLIHRTALPPSTLGPAHPDWLGQCRPDSAFLLGQGRHEMTVWDTAGTLARRFEVPASYALACGPTGRIAAIGAPLSGAASLVIRRIRYTVAELSLITSAGNSGAPLARVPVFNARFYPPRPLDPTATVAVTANRVYVGMPFVPNVTSYASDGVAEAIPVRVPLRHASARNFRAAIEAFLDIYAPPGRRADVREQVVSQVPKPKMLPPFNSVFADPAGRVWVELTFPGDSEMVLREVVGGGAHPGEIVVAHPLNIFAVGTDYVLGSYTAADSTPHVAIYTFAARR